MSSLKIKGHVTTFYRNYANRAGTWNCQITKTRHLFTYSFFKSTKARFYLMEPTAGINCEMW